MRLMTYIRIAQPSRLESLLILVARGVFYNLFFLFYIVSALTAPRVVGSLEEEAVLSYTEYLADMDDGHYVNGPAPAIAIDYWKLATDAFARRHPRRARRRGASPRRRS